MFCFKFDYNNSVKSEENTLSRNSFSKLTFIQSKYNQTNNRFGFIQLYGYESARRKENVLFKYETLYSKNALLFHKIYSQTSHGYYEFEIFSIQ